MARGDLSAVGDDNIDDSNDVVTVHRHIGNCYRGGSI